MTKKLALLFVLAFAILPSAASASISLGEANLNVLSRGLTGYWSMDGNTINWNTNTVRDLSVSGTTGTLVSMSTTSSPAPGKVGQALSFNGTNSYISTASNSGYTTTSQPLSVSFWMKPSDNGGTGEVLLTTAFDTAPFDGIWLQYGPGFGTGTTNSIIFGETDTTGAQFDAYSSNGSVPTNAWTQVVVVYNGSGAGGISIYINGISVSLTVHSASISTFLNSSWFIGASHTPDGYYSGRLDDFRIYNRALSPQEVQMLYMTGSFASGNTQATNSSFSIAQGGLNSGLVGYWPLDGNTTNWATGVTQDISGNALNGQMTNFSTSTSPAIGKIGQALTFNSSYITTGYTVPAQSSATSFTWSAWMYLNSTGGVAVILGNRGGGGASWIKLTPSAFEYSGAVVTNTLPTGKWIFVTIVKNGTNFTYYQNGSVVGTGTNSGSTSAYTFYMGEDPGFPSDGSFNGKLDDVRVYNRPLSQQEVQQLYQVGQVNIAHSNTSTGIGLNSGLVGYWTFDGPTINWATGVVKDMSGCGNNAQVSGMSTTTSPVIGKIGQALKFVNASQSYAVVLSPSGVPTIQSPETFSAWVNFSTLTPASGQLDDIIEEDNNVASQLEFYCYSASCSVANGAGISLVDASTISINKWHLLTYTFDGTTNKIYIDGVLSASNVAAHDTGTPSRIDIGGNSWQGQNFSTGKIDDARIYNRALSAQEIAQLYAAGR